MNGWQESMYIEKSPWGYSLYVKDQPKSEALVASSNDLGELVELAEDLSETTE